MKKLTLCAMLLSLAFFAFGCEQPKETAPATPPASAATVQPKEEGAPPTPPAAEEAAAPADSTK